MLASVRFLFRWRHTSVAVGSSAVLLALFGNWWTLPLVPVLFWLESKLNSESSR